ncbi:unnamed protein product [Gongylonema pulchrum]|uniref:Myosin motor domain-containing protein n=1 Tax=Gongylonema pulchrum TaxID=637853 RepID=A0A3P7NMQ5_9BILA|nr:unnamed protein product [Gongylonema pulchrum]
MFERKLYGLFDLLDNEARLPRSSAQHFTTVAHATHKENPYLVHPQSSRHHRAMREDEGFIVCHYASDVCYNTAQFLDKNNDTLHASLQCLMQQSRKVMKRPPSKKPQYQHKDLLELASFLQGTHFVRCIKPNSEMKPGQFDGGQILVQLRCAGMSSALKVMQSGFPSRISYLLLSDMYRDCLPKRLATLDAQMLCKVRRMRYFGTNKTV